MFGQPYQDAAGPIGRVRLNTGCNQTHDLVVEWLSIARLIFVPNHQIDRNSFEPPVRVCLHELTDEIDVSWVCDP